MDRKELEMTTNKKKVFVGVLFLAILLSGCETTKGAAKGVAYGVGTTAVGVGEGVVKDTENTCNFIARIDSWIKKNLW